MAQCSTLIVDDDEDMVLLAKTIIEVANEGLTVAGTASSGAEARVMVDSTRPDVVLMDHRMPEQSGLEVAADLLTEDPEQVVILFSAYLDTDTVRRAQEMGVRECVSKDRVSELPDIVRRWCPSRHS